MNDLLLGIDIGTSSVKGLICSSSGQFITQASQEHTLSAPRPGWSEESPADWWANLTKVVRQCLQHPQVSPEAIAAVGVSGMLPAVVVVDDSGQPLRPSMQQTDVRAIEEIEEVSGGLEPGAFFEKTGASLSQQSVGPKLLWLQKNEPDIWARTAKILGSYDFMNFRLTGKYGIESNWALESGLYDVKTAAWSDELLELFGVSRNQMPPIHAPHEIIGEITKEAAEATGLLAGTPVVAGTADHVGAALAAGIKEDGDLLIKFGSAGDILYSTEQLVLDPRLYIDYHDIPGKYLLNGCMATSGSLLKWYVEQFCQSDAQAAEQAGMSLYQYLDAQAAEVPAGSDGLIILPYFLGEKTPVLDPAARGVFFGMTLYHTRIHLYRAVLEAVVFGFKHHVEVLREQGQEPLRVVAGEGGARSVLWRQIAADCLGLPVSYLVNNPGASFAAAFVAGIGSGVFHDWNQIARFLEIEDTRQPNEENTRIYEKQYRIYREIYHDLKDDFRQLNSS